MTEGTSAIVADLRRAIVLLAELDDPAATRAAVALDRWLAGEDFEAAAGLAPGWRRSLQQAARGAALSALLAAHPSVDANNLARRIAAGTARELLADGSRPDGEDGLYHDLVRAGVHLSQRRWRQVIAEARGHRGHHLATAAMQLWSAPKRERKG